MARQSEVGKNEPALYVLFAATGCLLSIACLNITNLLVARAASRRKESAIQTALGGSRARLIREQVTEHIVAQRTAEIGIRSVVLILVSGVACMIPAWRASRLDPMQALRTE